MGTYVILSKRTPEGDKALKANPEGMLDIVRSRPAGVCPAKRWAAALSGRLAIVQTSCSPSR